MVNGLKVFVAMPAFNEASHIGDVIRHIPDLVDKIIVIDDHSTDNTSQVSLDAGDSRLELIRNPENLGVGGATIAAYRRALAENANIVVKLDADGQMNPQAIAELIKPIVEGKADYTKGFRFHDRETLRKMPKARLIGNIGLSYLVKMASGYWNIFDPINGFTAIHHDTLRLIDLDKLSKDYFFETDMLCNLYRVRALVKDVLLPTHYGDEISRVSLLKTLVQFPGRLFRAYVQRIIWHYYIRDFSTFSLLYFNGWLLMLFGIIFGAIKWYLSAVRGVVTSTGTVMISVVPLVLGFQMLLQAILLDVHNVPNEPLQKYCRDETS